MNILERMWLSLDRKKEIEEDVRKSEHRIDKSEWRWVGVCSCGSVSQCWFKDIALTKTAADFPCPECGRTGTIKRKVGREVIEWVDDGIKSITLEYKKEKSCRKK